MQWEEVIPKLKPLNEEYIMQAQERLDQLTKPKGSLGQLEQLAMRLSAIYQSIYFSVDPITHYVFVGDHGITAEGVSAFPSEVTTQMVYNFLQGGAAINVLTKNNNVAIKVVDVGMKDTIADPRLIQRKIKKGTNNFLFGKAMSKKEVYDAIQVGFQLGIEEVEQGTKMLSIGEMGIGNTTSSAAIAAHLLELPVEQMTGKGTGLDDIQLKHKINVIRKAFEKHQLATKDAVETLATFGGVEHAAMTGMIIAASYKQIPVLLDGLNTGAAALAATYIHPLTSSYMIAAHQSEEPGHAIILKVLQLKPLLQLSLRLGEGTGAILALPLIRSTQHLLQEMATFSQAKVSQKER